MQKLETKLGESIATAGDRALSMAQATSDTVEFAFNGITCHVHAQTNIDLLVRDYFHADLMGWKIIGPNCVAEYDGITTATIDNSRTAQKKRQIEGAITQVLARNVHA